MKTITIIKAADRRRYKQAAHERHIKTADMQYYIPCTALYAMNSRSDALSDIRSSNRLSKTTTFFMEEINLY